MTVAGIIFGCDSQEGGTLRLVLSLPRTIQTGAIGSFLDYVLHPNI
jgi:hypothetical protein